MLQHTFCHIPGIGPKTETLLWSSGVLTWHAAGECAQIPLSPRRMTAFRRHVEQSIVRLAGRDARFFYSQLRSSQHWRLFPEFRDSVAYVDIETTGLGDVGDYITTIALYDGRSIAHFVQGDNLESFQDAIADYQLIVTYNGKCFDVPFIRRYFTMPMDQAHIDLRYVLASLGYRGGLKGCEVQLGIDRRDLADVDGYFAVLLWHDFCRNHNDRALETLLAYNVLDVVNLESLMVMAYNLKLQATPFADSLCLPPPQAPPNPFQADRETIDRLRAEFFWGV
jgi:uncharacterized protein YprB with RNaseH-like and TPR domain